MGCFSERMIPLCKVWRPLSLGSDCELQSMTICRTRFTLANDDSDINESHLSTVLCYSIC